MSHVSHQTIKLKSGKHSSPDEGACVMELASMLAGEAFSDHPVSVCPVIGSVLRTYNDLIDDRRRQDLYKYASMVVGSASSREVQRLRKARLGQWSLSIQKRKFTTLLGRRRLSRAERLPNEWIGTLALRPLRPYTDSTHASVLALIEELLAIAGDRRVAAPVAVPRDGSPSAPAAPVSRSAN